jgi:acyl-CoA thioester hydrolase
MARAAVTLPSRMAASHDRYGHGVRCTVEPSTDPSWYHFAHDIRVRFSETDAMGIVHHSSYLPYLEEARVAYLRHIGHPYSEMRADGADYAVLETHVRYIQPLRFDDVVTVHLRLASVARSWFDMAYLLQVNGDLRSTATTAHACVNAQGRPARLPPWLRALAPID